MPNPSLTTRLSLATKAFRMVWNGLGGSSWPGFASSSGTDFWNGLLSGTGLDYKKLAGDLWRCSTVAAVIDWKQKAIGAPRLQVLVTGPDGKEQEDPKNALTALIRRPNPYYSGKTLLGSTLLSWDVDGNAYWIKARGMGGVGAPMQLWWTPHWRIEPQWSQQGDEFIGWYRYAIGDGTYTRLEPEDVVHFRNGLDPNNPRKGLSALQSMLREVCGVNEAATYTTSILRNAGAVPVMLVPTDGSEVTKEFREELLRLWAARTGADERGKPLIPSGSFRVERLGLSPVEMDLGQMVYGLDDRICAALGVSAMVVHLPSGALSKTYANMAEARSGAWEDTILPTLGDFADTLDAQLLPDLGGSNPEHVAWDTSGVRALSDDQDMITKRAVLAYQGGIWKRSEAREATGQEFGPDDESYFGDGGVSSGGSWHRAPGPSVKPKA